MRGGRFVLPGGAAADPIWTEIFGVPPSERNAFLKALYNKDGGKGAYVVDVLQHLPDEKVRELLFGPAPGSFRRLYEALDPAGEAYQRTHRDPYDFAHLAPLMSLSPEEAAALVVASSKENGFPRNEAELAGAVARERSTERPYENSCLLYTSPSPRDA